MASITIKDIAKICGVGVSTVSRALNNHPDINPDTKQKILEIVEEYGFVPNSSARNLKITDSNTIAVITKGRSNPFFMEMIGVMENVIHDEKYSMELRQVDERSDEVDVAIELVREMKVKGIIFLGGISDQSADKLEKIGVPFILSTIAMKDGTAQDCSSISVDDVAESYKITKYLIDKGHRKIAFMGAPKDDESIGKLRLEGFRKAFKDCKISLDEELIKYSKDALAAFSMENGYNLMKQMIEDKCDFTAVYAVSDTMAIGAIRALAESGKKVPDDVSVAGFDGIETGEYYVPSLTTIKQPFEDMAYQTAQHLMEIIRKGVPHRQITLEAQLVERESVKAI